MRLAEQDYVCPFQYLVTAIRRGKRACGDCKAQGLKTTPVLECIVAKSVLSDQVIVDAVVAKLL